MQNLFFLAAPSIAREGKVYFGTGNGKIGMIDLRDLVDCAEHSVISDAYHNQIFTLTGPETLSFHDVTVRLTNILGQPIQYVPVPPEAVEQSVQAMGMGDWYARVTLLQTMWRASAVTRRAPSTCLPVRSLPRLLGMATARSDAGEVYRMSQSFSQNGKNTNL